MDNEMNLNEVEGNTIPFLLKIQKQNAQYEICLPKDLITSDLFSAIAELTSIEVKSLRLLYKGRRIVSDQHKTIPEDFDGDGDFVREVIVFAESSGATF